MALKRFQLCSTLLPYNKDHKKRKYIKAGERKWLKNQLNRYLRYRSRDFKWESEELGESAVGGIHKIKKVYKGYD